MSCDIDYRYRRALQPDGLATYETALQALNEAVGDVRLAGRDVSTCPAVLLLTRHLSRLADGSETLGRSEDKELKDKCLERIAVLKHKPAIIALVRRGLDYKTEELRHYRREGSRTLRLLATELGLSSTNYRLDYVTPREALAGDHILEGRGVYIRISPERFGEQGVAWRNPFWKGPGSVMRKAPITALADLPALARRISRELKLKKPAQAALI